MAQIKRPPPPAQIEIPETTIAQMINIIDHRNNDELVASIVNLMLAQGGRKQDAAARLDALTAIRMELCRYLDTGVSLHHNAYYFVKTLMENYDIGQPGAVPVPRPKPAGKRPVVSLIPEPDKLARKKRTIRKLREDA